MRGSTTTSGSVVPLDRHLARFPGPHLRMVCDSILAGNTDGELWSLPTAGGAPFLVLWDGGNNVFYLSGEIGAEASLAAASELLADLRTNRAPRRFKVRPLSRSIRRALPQLFPSVALTASESIFMTMPSTAHPPDAAPVPEGIEIVPITRTLLEDGSLSGRADVLEEIRGMWPSDERFDRYGFGTAAVTDGAIICLCTAEYVGPTYCGIGIATAEEFRRRGIATAAASAFIEESRRRELVPCWECARANVPSVRVAEKLGFVVEEEEMYWIATG